MGVVYSQTGVLAKGRAMSSAGENEELGRELGLAGASLPPKAGTRHEAGVATQVPYPETHGRRRACPIAPCNCNIEDNDLFLTKVLDKPDLRSEVKSESKSKSRSKCRDHNDYLGSLYLS